MARHNEPISGMNFKGYEVVEHSGGFQGEEVAVLHGDVSLPVIRLLESALQ